MFFDESENAIDKKYYTDYLLNKYKKLGLNRIETAAELRMTV